MIETQPKETLDLTFPVLLVSSYLFKGSAAVSEYLGLALTRYQRDARLDPKMIYETESCPEAFIRSRQVFFLFAQWDDHSKVTFLNRVKTMKKAELPASLLKYCKKNGEDAVPYIDKVFCDMQGLISELQKAQPELVLHLEGPAPEVSFPRLYSMLQSLPKASVGEPKENREQRKNPQQNNLGGGLCLILVFFGIPGMGKTFLTPSVRAAAIKNNFEFFLLSSDEVRNQCMLAYQRKHPSCDQQKAFENSFKASNKQFSENLLSKIHSNSGKLLVFLDKNFTPAAFDKLHHQLTKSNFKSTSIRILSLSPKSSVPLSLAEKTFPFSLEFLLLCLKRSLIRGPHLTLNGEKSKIASVVFTIFTYFSGFEVSKLHQKIDQIIELPFFDEEEARKRIPIDLKTAVLNKLGALNSELEIDPQLEDLANQVLQVEFSDINISELVEESISAVLQPFSQEVREVKKSKKQKKDFRKPPVYIGIKVEKSIRPIVLDFVIENLNKLQQVHQDPRILQDIQQIQQLKQGSRSSWKYPLSFHLTCMFIGRASEKYSSRQFQDFVCDIKVSLRITHFVYSPGLVACAKAEVVSPHVDVENKLPHITLLLGSKPAVYSNTILQHVDLSQELFCTTFNDQGCKNVVYSFKLPVPHEVSGKNSYFY